MMIARSAELVELLEERLFESDIARASGEPPSGSRERLEGWLWTKLSFLPRKSLIRLG
jgi:hypothetical protein